MGVGRHLGAFVGTWNRGGMVKRFALAIALIIVATPFSETVARAQSQNLSDLSSQGKAALGDEQFERAEKIYEQIVRLDPRSAEAHSNFGFALYMQGSYLNAIAQFRKALDLDPHLDRTQVLLALSYFDSADLEHAVPLLEKAVAERRCRRRRPSGPRLFKTEQRRPSSCHAHALGRVGAEQSRCSVLQGQGFSLRGLGFVRSAV
jgi:tetratricopeptide (TPR) repeat protein